MGKITANLKYNLIIIGGGPAGLSAGIYACRAGLKVLLLEKMAPGGQLAITNSMENYPGTLEKISGFELAEKFRQQAEKFGLEIEKGEVKEIREKKGERFKTWKVVAGKKIYPSLAVIIATGARPKKLKVPGEEELIGKGVSYCATCDGPLFKDKEVVVAGGGDTAIKEALFLSQLVRKVWIVHRRDRLRAAKILQDRALANKKLNFIWESAVSRIWGKEKVEAVEIEKVKSGEKEKVPADGIFIFIGYEPNTKLVANLVNLDREGYIITDEEMRTSRKGIFAGGDCRQKYLKQVITACSDGAIAGVSAKEYIDELKGTKYD